MHKGTGYIARNLPVFYIQLQSGMLHVHVYIPEYSVFLATHVYGTVETNKKLFLLTYVLAILFLGYIILDTETAP